jgi:hypothetical protein
MLEDPSKLVDLIQKAAATVAFLAGGFWVLMNYWRNRTHVPRLISIPDNTIHAFHMRLRVVAHGETFTVDAVAVAKQPSHATSRSA